MPEESTGLLCERCGKNPRLPKHAWCRECKTEKQRDYAEARDMMFKRRGFKAGVEAMRQVLAAEFDRLGSGMFTGDECAALILQAPGPDTSSIEEKEPEAPAETAAA